MKRVTGIGGIFFNANDPVTLRAWYRQHLGIDVQEWGAAADGPHFAPSMSSFMINDRVEDLAALLQAPPGQ